MKISDLVAGDIIKLKGATINITDSSPSVSFNKGFESGSLAARGGPLIIPSGPSGASVDRNIEKAKGMSVFDFRNHVKTKGPWDYKQIDRRYAPYGNFNYGATGRTIGGAGGLPGGTLLQWAGRAQIAAGTNMKEWGEPGGWLPGTGSGSNGDDPEDQFWIQQGIRYEGR